MADKHQKTSIQQAAEELYGDVCDCIEGYDCDVDVNKMKESIATALAAAEQRGLERAAQICDRKSITRAYGHHSMAYESAADAIRSLKPGDTP